MSKLTKKEKRIRKIVIIIVAILTIILAFLIGKNNFNHKENPKEPASVKIDDAIEEYGYELPETATTYYKELFNKLKILLNSDEVVEEEYAKLVAQMFAADFYNLDNKLTNSDIGGIKFVNKDIQTNFKLAAQNTMYNNIENNIYGNRNQKLPIVSQTTVNSVQTTKYTLNDISDDKAYQINVSIAYTEDLGYPKEVNIILIHSNNKLEITKVW